VTMESQWLRQALRGRRPSAASRRRSALDPHEGDHLVASARRRADGTAHRMTDLTGAGNESGPVTVNRLRRLRQDDSAATAATAPPSKPRRPVGRPCGGRRRLSSSRPSSWPRCSSSQSTSSASSSTSASRRRLIEEYGRHTGQADLLREAVDGRVGEDPPGPAVPFDLPGLTLTPRPAATPAGRAPARAPVPRPAASRTAPCDPTGIP
jgi:hypothetical protein